jgi:hypothetical protein
MKRIVKIVLALIPAFLLPAVILTAQEKEKEKHVKIVIADKSGTRVEIDTLMKGDKQADSIKLKNGEVIYLTRHGKSGSITHMEGDKGNMVVTYSSDDKGDKKTQKKVIIVSDDTEKVLEGGDVIIVRAGKHMKEGKDGNAVTWSSTGGDPKGSKYIYINEDKNTGEKGEKTIEVKVTTDDNNNTVEKTKYIIAKDGMVVTVEGNDEAKAKEIIKEVEIKLGVSKEDKNIKKEGKEETKKSKK